MSRGNLCVAILTVFVLTHVVGCGPSKNSPEKSNGSPDKPGPGTSKAPDTRSGTIKLTSSAFEHNGTIPDKHTGVGGDASPPLSWSGAPAGAKSFALICDDPDAGDEPFVHWVIYNIPGDVTELPEKVERKPEPSSPKGAQQGKNGGFESGYFGPMPPPGKPHRYVFKIYALDSKLNLAPDDTEKPALLEAMEGHILADGELIGKFERKKKAD